RGSQTSDFSSVRVCAVNARARIPKIRVIEQIISVHTEFSIETFRDLERLGQRQVVPDSTRPTEAVASNIAASAASRQSEQPRSGPSEGACIRTNRERRRVVADRGHWSIVSYRVSSLIERTCTDME